LKHLRSGWNHKLNIEELIREVSKKEKVILTDLKVNKDYPIKAHIPYDSFVNRSFSVGNEIILGIYKNQERKIISFFHELAHIKNTKNYSSKYLEEKAMWKISFQLAKKYGIPKFSKKTTEWYKNQLKSYNKGK